MDAFLILRPYADPDQTTRLASAANNARFSELLMRNVFILLAQPSDIGGNRCDLCVTQVHCRERIILLSPSLWRSPTRNAFN